MGQIANRMALELAYKAKEKFKLVLIQKKQEKKEKSSKQANK